MRSIMTAMERSMIAKAKAYKKHGLLDAMKENAKRVRAEIIEESRKARAS